MSGERGGGARSASDASPFSVSGNSAHNPFAQLAVALNEQIPDIELVAVIIGLVSAAIDNVPLVAARTPSVALFSLSVLPPSRVQAPAAAECALHPANPPPFPAQATMGMYDLEQYPMDNPLWQARAPRRAPLLAPPRLEPRLLTALPLPASRSSSPTARAPGAASSSSAPLPASPSWRAPARRAASASLNPPSRSC